MDDQKCDFDTCYSEVFNLFTGEEPNELHIDI